MKVYVITAQEREAVRRVANTLCSGDTNSMGGIDCAYAAMTHIDIPDGCVLAVVDNSPKPDFSVVKGANGALHAAGIALGQEAMWDNGYRRVIQEVKL